MEIKEPPLGFVMALGQNEAAMKRFESLTRAEKQAVIQQARQMKSKSEMRQLVSRLAD